ncbi:MAG: hypothetical protein KDC34_08000 [Saprospiraceae bacterium]|nr:hypothetical protein [Saprospiraceae bacterium]
MKKLNFLVLALSIFAFTACDKVEDDTMDTTPEYHIHFHSPDSADKTVGETITIKIDFEDHNGGTVHHVNVRVYNKADGTEIFNKPSDAHVHETSGMYSFEDTLELNVDPDTNWVVEAKVWGHEDGLAEVSETVEFKVVN